MPVKQGRDSDGPYFQYGSEGKKYYYKAGDWHSRKRAKLKAQTQRKAIKVSQQKAEG